MGKAISQRTTTFTIIAGWSCACRSTCFKHYLPVKWHKSELRQKVNKRWLTGVSQECELGWTLGCYLNEPTLTPKITSWYVISTGSVVTATAVSAEIRWGLTSKSRVKICEMVSVRSFSVVMTATSWSLTLAGPSTSSESVLINNLVDVTRKVLFNKKRLPAKITLRVRSIRFPGSTLRCLLGWAPDKS